MGSSVLLFIGYSIKIWHPKLHRPSQILIISSNFTPVTKAKSFFFLLAIKHLISAWNELTFYTMTFDFICIFRMVLNEHPNLYVSGSISKKWWQVHQGPHLSLSLFMLTKMQRRVGTHQASPTHTRPPLQQSHGSAAAVWAKKFKPHLKRKFIALCIHAETKQQPRLSDWKTKYK